MSAETIVSPANPVTGRPLKENPTRRWRSMTSDGWGLVRKGAPLIGLRPRSPPRREAAGRRRDRSGATVALRVARLGGASTTASSSAPANAASAPAPDGGVPGPVGWSDPARAKRLERWWPAASVAGASAPPVAAPPVTGPSAADPSAAGDPDPTVRGGTGPDGPRVPLGCRPVGDRRAAG